MREWESNRTKANPQNSQSFLLGISKREREKESEREDGKRYSYSSEECFVRQFWLSSSPYYKTSPSNSKVSLNLMLVKMSFFPYLVSNFLYLFAVCNLPSPGLLVLPFAAFDLLFCFVAGWANDSSSWSGALTACSTSLSITKWKIYSRIFSTAKSTSWLHSPYTVHSSALWVSFLNEAKSFDTVYKHLS